MRDTRTYSLFPSNLSLPDAFRASDRSLSSLGYTEASGLCGSTGYSATVDSTRMLSTDTWKEFLPILDHYPRPQRIDVHSHWRAQKHEDIELLIHVRPDEIEIAVGSADPAVLELLHAELQRAFGASNPTPQKSCSLSKPQLKKSIFLAHRFDECGKDTAAAVEKFLSRCGFSVVQGEGYEARMVPAKVAERIENQDILLALFTPGEATWVSSEAAFALAKRKYVVFLAQEGLDVKKGIAGADYEHLTFPQGQVEKAFSDLIYALP
jgi:hypothetical protein